MLPQEDLFREKKLQVPAKTDFSNYKASIQTQPSAPEWNPSQEYLDAQTALKEWQQDKPSSYQSSYSDTISKMLDSITNREPFSYDMNADPLYQQYKDQYVKQGQQAARDVTGQAAALTGGYGNSYAATAGNLAYQNSLGQLNSIVPELYGQAASQYYQQGQQMRDNLAAVQNQESIAFGQYQSGVDNYYTGLNAAMDASNNAYSQDYGRHQDAVSQWQFGQNLDFQRQQEQNNMDLQRSQADQAQSNWVSEMGAKYNKPNKYGFTNGQEAAARDMMRKNPQAAIQYVNQLNLSKSGKTHLLQALGLYGAK